MSGTLIRFGEEEWTRHRSGLVLPTWATTVALAAEARITAERVAIEDKLLRIRNARRIIVDKGNSLSRECSRILQEILAPEGFRVTWTEQEGNHDIEMVSGTSTVLVQVRGASEGITVELPRQLMHHMQIFRPITSELKGMMIANAFREVPPDARPPAFSRETVDLAERNNYCAMTTYQLLQVYDGVVAGTIRPADFLARLKATAGVFSMPSAGI